MRAGAPGGMLPGMATLAQSIQTQIDAIDAQMASVTPTSYSANGVSGTNPAWLDLSKRRAILAGQLARLNGTSPMIVRGVVKGL